MNNTETSLNKEAADAIREIYQENQELKASLEKFAFAEELGFEMLNSGAIAISELQEKITDLKTRDMSELHIIKEALHLSKTASSQSLFKVSKSNANYANLDALSRGLLESL